MAASLGGAVCLGAGAARAQDSGDIGIELRGGRAELSITIRDRSGQVVAVPASVKIYKEGIPLDQQTVSRGRTHYLTGHLGDYTIAVEAAGYRAAQKDITVTVPGKMEIDIVLQKDTENERGEATGSAGGTGVLLAPKAREALDKATKAAREDQLDEAQKYMDEAMKLAPGNPDVLYAQGVVYLRRREWAKATGVLEKSVQLDGNRAAAVAALGMAYCDEKKYAQAATTLEKALQMDPAAGWETQWALAKADYHLEKYDEALKMVRQAQAAAKQTVPQIELLLAQCLTAGQMYEEAAQVLRGVLQANSEGEDADTARRWLAGLAANGKIQVGAGAKP